MSLRLKRIVFALLFVVVSIAVGVALWFVFFRTTIETPTTTDTAPEFQGGLSPSGDGGPTPTTQEPGTGLTPSGTVPSATGAPSRVTLISDSITQSVVPSEDGRGARYYSPEDGRFYRVLANGDVEQLADKQFFNVESVSWAHGLNHAILEFPDGNNIAYDFQAKRQTTLPRHWEDFSFSPDDEFVVSKSVALDERSRFLVVSDKNGREARAIESIGKNQDKIITSWSPNKQIVALSMTGSAQPDGAQQILFVGENNENYKSLIAPGRGFIPNWSPTGQQILFSVYHERTELKPELWIAGSAGNTIGEGRKNLRLNTWADKCVWESETVILCGVPQSLEYGAGLAPDNFRSIPDDLYRIDLQNGVSSKIGDPDQNLPIRNPVLSKDKSTLFFSHAVSGRLYQYDL